MAKLNFDYYNDEKDYSDGPVEKEILEIVKSGENFQNVIEKDDRWPILYHLSHLRENILNWYDFEKNANLLEIGAGCGAITGMLCDQVERVVSVELTKDRSQVIYERHKNKKNLEIIVGNFHNINFNEKFDYIVLNGVFEYAASFTKTKDPYLDLLKDLKNLLKDDGILLIAIENRLGLKYFNGAKEDHTSQLFTGLNDYPYETSVKTFSQNEFIRLGKKAEFLGCSFFYPFYDYKFTDMIFTKESFDSIDFDFFTHAFDNERFDFFDEREIMRTFIDEGIYEKFANSFLVELSPLEKSDDRQKTIFAKISNQRKEKYQIITKIIRKNNQKYVIKEGLTNESVKHLKEMLENQKNSIEGFENIKISEIEKGIKMNFLTAQTLEDELIDLLRKKENVAFENILKDFAGKIRNDSFFSKCYQNDEFQKVFGSSSSIEGLYCRKNINIDMLFSNIFYNNKTYQIIDYEWTFSFAIPVDFVIWRSLNMFYYYSPLVNKIYSYEKLLNIVGIEDKHLIDKFEIWNQEFGFNYVGVERFNQYEKDHFTLEKYSEDILKQNIVESRLHFDTGNGFNVKESIHNFFNIKDRRIQVSYDFSKKKQRIQKLRWDPCEDFCKIRNIKIKSNCEAIEIFPLNCAYKDKNWSYFLTKDPIYLFRGKIESIDYLRIECEIEKLENDEIKIAMQCLEEKKENQKNQQEAAYKKLEKKYYELQNSYETISNSFSWKMTTPIRTVLDKSKYFLKKGNKTKLLYKGIATVKNEGISTTKLKLSNYLKRKNQIKTFRQKTGIDISLNDNNQEVSVYDSVYQKNQDFSGLHTTIKTLALYLPQFHEIKENNEWWGKGFTEWTNTQKMKARFNGHYQPRIPHSDIGYYDLDNIETMKKQVELAKRHGIFGFCFYYYWFSGRRIMEKPVDMLLEHPEIDTNFCLCWANENFTRAWDGQNKEVLLGQSYSTEDQTQFILDLKKYIDDKRYIRIDQKPLIMVYNPGQIPDIKETFEQWRQTAQSVGIGDILIWTCQTANNTARSLDIENIIDAEVEFPPHNMWHDVLGVRDIDLDGKAANIYNYNKLVQLLEKQYELNKDEERKVPLHRTCMMGWDNSARRENNWTTFYAYTLESFYRWFSLIVNETEKKYPEKERFTFVNAWNEWAEGTYLEPDEKYGYANINTLSKALYKIPFDSIQVLNKAVESSKTLLSTKAEIAVQIHLFYIDTIQEIIKEVNKIPYKFDCFISTDTEGKKKYIELAFQAESKAKSVSVEVFENRGRDVAPFLIQMKDRISHYKYICHIHSKKTKTNDYGTMWRKYLYKNLFGSEENIKKIIDIFEKNGNEIGIIYPENFPIVSKQATWGSNEVGCKILFEKLKLDIELNNIPAFPVGNMFWARSKAIEKIFQYGFLQDDFPHEEGQVNLTLAHQIERSWCYIAEDAGYTHQKIYNAFFENNDYPCKKRVSIFVHFDQNNLISESDIAYIKACSEFSQYFVFVTNSNLKENNLKCIRKYVNKIIIRENVGYDFAAWRDAFFEIEVEMLKQFDELVLINNSCYLFNNNLRYIFNQMEEKKCDFWGMTISPYLNNGEYIKEKCIDEHIQSYFQVFNKEVFLSDVFIDFFGTVNNETNLIKVIANYETKLTKKLNRAGFKYDVFVEETKLLGQFINNYSIPYEYPLMLMLLDLPLVKKKSNDYMSTCESVKVNDFIKQFEV